MQENPEDEIYILGIYRNRLLYYAKVTDVMDMTEYFSEKRKREFGKRKDHIYDVRDGGLERNDFVPYIHAKGDIRNVQDANGVFAVLSEEFTYMETVKSFRGGQLIYQTRRLISHEDYIKQKGL